MYCVKIGYFADGPWAHKAFEKIIKDNAIQIVFITVRYDKEDKVLLDFAHRYQIPVEISDNINSQAFINTVKRYKADLFVSMSFNQVFKDEIRNLPK